jgi:hypothetical protein
MQPLDEPEDPTVVHARIEDWRRRLIDLTYRNRLVRYVPAKATSLTLVAPDVHTILADPERRKPWQFYLPPEDRHDERDAESETAEFLDDVVVSHAHRARAPRSDELVASEPSAKRINRILDNLAKRSNAEFEDKALRILYLAVGFLDWVDPARDQRLTSPLVLVPVRLARQSASQPYAMFFVDDEEIVINPSLTEKLRRDAQLGLPDDWAWEDKPIDVELEEIRAAVAPHGWTVREDAALGLFSFQKYVMYRDLLDNEQHVAAHPIVRRLAAKQPLTDQRVQLPGLARLDDAQPPDQALSIRDADATQRLCLEAARQGQSFVMHGPPGTGKSQTIANLIVEAIGQGKKVLFVSEKAAALDVVYNRLAEHDLQEYVLMLHGEHAARREVVHALAASLTSEMVPRPGMSRDDFDRLATLRTLLNESVDVLHVAQPTLGQTALRDVYGELVALHAAPVVPGAPQASDVRGDGARQEYQQLRETFARLAERWRVAGQEFPWRGFDGTSFRDDERAALLALLERLGAATQQIQACCDSVAAALGLELPGNPEAAHWLAGLEAQIASTPLLESAWLRQGGADAIDHAAATAREGYAEHAAALDELARLLPGRSLGELPSDAGDRFAHALDATERELGRTDAWEHALVARLADLSRLADALPVQFDDAGRLGATVAETLGHPDRPRTLKELGRLVELARLAFEAEHKPDPEWLLASSLHRAQSTLADLRQTLEHYAAERAALLEDYDLDVFALDAKALRTRWRREWNPLFLERERSYRADLAALAATRRDREAPADPTSELAAFQAFASTRADADRTREATLARFNANALELDAYGLLARFLGPHAGTFAKLGKAYRADAKSIKGARSDGKLGDNLLEDLALLAEHQQLERSAGEQRDALLERYEDAAFELDHNALAERFATRYTLAFLARHVEYHADLELLGRHRAESLDEDAATVELDRLAHVQSLGWLLDERSERLRVAFGGYYLGRDTDPQRIEQALAVATRTLELADRDADLDALRAHLALGARPDPELARRGDRLTAALAEADSQLDSLAPIAAHLPRWRDELDTQALSERIGSALAGIAPLAAMAAVLTDNGRQPGELPELAQRALAIDRARTADGRLADATPGWTATLGRRFNAADTDWEDCRAAAGYLCELEQYLSVYPQALEHHAIAPAALAETLLGERDAAPAPGPLAAACESYDELSEQLAGHFEPERRTTLEAFAAEAVWADLRAEWTRLRNHIDDVRDYLELRRAHARAGAAGWGDFVAELLDGDVPADAMVDAFERAWWTRRLEALDTEAPDLLADDGTTYTRWIGEFRELDRRLVATGPDRLIAARNSLRHDLVDGAGSEVAILKGEAGKRRRFRPVRKLLAGMPSLLSELKPCLMMSPLTVSHFLSPDHRFDLVVFDEASQVPPWDAINCIYRGEQLIVAGDSNQLPPTSFFQISEGPEAGFDEETEATEEDMESILDACKVLLPEHPLKWHYRSRNEQLIAFSNRHIYDDRLWTFPAAWEAGPRTGIGFVHVPDGLYDRGRSSTNRREAQVVAERVASQLRDGSGRSVGVIAFNAAQAEAIGEELDRQRIEHPELEQHFARGRLDSVFVKHLEAVQGDERDVIIFSIGYGYDADGRFPMQFGPLGRAGGHRRLNVAITRAREYVEVVSSVLPTDFTLEEGTVKHRGPTLLRRYLEYARENAHDRAEEIEPDHANADALSGFERELAEVVNGLGYQVVSDVGRGPSRIDLGVRHPADPDRFMLGIVTDGRNYAGVPTCRDRDRLRESVFSSLGWRLHPVWSIDWVNNRREQIQRLNAALEDAQHQGGDAGSNGHARGERQVEESLPAAVSEPAADPPVERERRDRPLVDVREDPTVLPWVHLYECAQLRPVDSFYEFPDASHQSRQVEMVIEVANIEAPVHLNLLARRLADAYGTERVTQRVLTAVKRAVEKAQRQYQVELRGEFVWRNNQTMPAVRTPDPDDPLTRRDLNEIACLELTSALVRMRKASPGASIEHLLPQAARVFGFERTGGRIRERFQDCLRKVSLDVDTLADDG